MMNKACVENNANAIFKSENSLISALFFAFFIFFFFTGSEARAYSIYLKNVAVLRGDSARLGDLARVDGEEISGRISSQIVVDAGQVPEYINRDELTALLSKFPEKLHRIYGRGVWILPLTQEIRGDELHEMLEREFEKVPGKDADRKSLVFYLEKDAKLDCFRGCRMDFQLPSNLSKLFAGKRVISADITSVENGRKKILYRQRLVVRVLRKMEVPVASRNLEIGMRLTENDFQMQSRELDPDETFHATGKLIGRRVVAAVKEGGILNHSSVQFLPAVRRGQAIAVVFQTTNVVVKMRSIAASDGEIGDTIPVRLLLPSGIRSDIKKVRIVSDEAAVLE